MTTRSEKARQQLLNRAQAMFPDSSTPLSDYQKCIRSKVSSASCRKNGAKGYAALVAVGKEDIARKKSADYRFDHPSDLEQIVIAIFQQYRLPVDRQHREVEVGRFFVDFKYGDLVVEVNDDTWHTNDFHGDDRVAHDQGKYAYLRSQGLTVIILSEKVVRSSDVGQFIGDLMLTIRQELAQEF